MAILKSLYWLSKDSPIVSFKYHPPLCSRLLANSFAYSHDFFYTGRSFSDIGYFISSSGESFYSPLDLINKNL
jgi:hypothetical protein